MGRRHQAALSAFSAAAEMWRASFYVTLRRQGGSVIGSSLTDAGKRLVTRRDVVARKRYISRRAARAFLRKLQRILIDFC